jgi:diguanylate cyclase (GGDEF)-like protein/PAS domain S-box-containing protein
MIRPALHEAADFRRAGNWRARPIWPSIVAAIIGLALSIAAWLATYFRENQFAELELETAVANHALVLQSGMDDYLNKVVAGRALFESSGPVTRQAFSVFGNSILQNQAPMRDVNWIARITRDEREATELAARRDGLPGFRITSVASDGRLVPAPEKDEYFPELYTAKEPPDSPVYGLDLYDGGFRQRTLERARDSGEMATSDSFVLQTGEGDRTGFFVVLAVYRQGLPHDTVQQRRDNLVGFVEGVFQTRLMIENILQAGTTPIGLDLYFFSGPGSDASQLHFHPSRLRTTPTSAEPRSVIDAGIHRLTELRVGDRKWTMVSAPMPGGPGTSAHAPSSLVLFGALSFSALTAAFLWASGRNAQRIQAANDDLDHALDTLDATNDQLTAQNTRFDAALNNMAQGLIMFDAAGNVVVRNQRYIDMYGLSPEFVRPGLPLRDLLRHQFESHNSTVDPDQRCAEILSAVSRKLSTTHFIETDDGRVISVLLRPMSDGGSVATHEDITERRRTEAKIAYMADHDILTDLPNRKLFREQLDENLARVARGGNLALLCLDIDHFKDVNDTLGHAIGDMLLTATADRLRKSVRAIDLVARLGGDEFTIMQVGISGPADATNLATRVIEAVSQPYDIDGHQVVVGMSVGISLAPGDGTDAYQLLRNADMALYRAKADGRGRYCFFEAEMDARMQARRVLELDLRKALAKGEFELFYQPLVNARTECICGLEALVRWHHPQRGMIAPLDFIPLAEETGLIVPLGEWILRQACNEAAGWADHISIAINLSPVQFKSKNLVAAVKSALTQSGLAPHRLELEITETVLLQDEVGTLATLHQFRELGIRISMDDFGTGYSSLGYLRKFPFDKIKIDRSFISDMSEHHESLAIVRALTAMGTNLGIATTAEGVETSEQLKQLRKEGCTEVQGFLFSVPRPAAEIRKLFDLTGSDLKATT